MSLDIDSIQPVEFKCLVEVEEVEEKTAGGLFIPDVAKDKEQQAQSKALLKAVGGNAFEDWSGIVPRVGDTVYIAKYAGRVLEDEKHRIIQDKDICAVVAREV